MKTKYIILLLVFFFSFQSNAFALQSWEEDTDGDGRKETKFYDDDGDGIPDNASVDKDGDGIYEEYWVDKDDDGDWDRMWRDSDGDGQWDKGRFDNDGDNNWDEEWTDRNGNGKVDGNGNERDNIDVPVGGPRPAVALAVREECNCAGPREEPEYVGSGSSSNILIWSVSSLLFMVLIFILWSRRKASGS